MYVKAHMMAVTASTGDDDDDEDEEDEEEDAGVVDVLIFVVGWCWRW